MTGGANTPGDDDDAAVQDAVLTRLFAADDDATHAAAEAEAQAIGEARVVLAARAVLRAFADDDDDRETMATRPLALYDDVDAVEAEIRKCLDTSKKLLERVEKRRQAYLAQVPTPAHRRVTRYRIVRADPEQAA